jgi:prepilin-type N-terminal cleavage/methylation domain-containing protein
MYRNNLRNEKTGFTLIELLVVVAIIGIISSIVLGSIKTARDKALKARAISDMRQIINAIIIAQGEQNHSLYTFAPAANCMQCYCVQMHSAACTNRWENALAQIEAATNGIVTGLSKFKYNPWGQVYLIDANQGEPGFDCATVDGFWVYGQTIPGMPTIPLSSSCP